MRFQAFAVRQFDRYFAEGASALFAYRDDAGAFLKIVYTRVIQPGREPIELNYRLEKLEDGWKIYDVNVLGAWLVETYKGTFASEISKSGIDGLIKTLADKNRKLASGPVNSRK